MFSTLSSSLETEAELQVLLGLLPESKGGAGLLALGLLSTDARCGLLPLLRLTFMINNKIIGKNATVERCT